MSTVSTTKQQRRTAVVASRLSPDLRERLHTKAERLRLTESTAIEQAIREWVKQRGGAG